MSDCGKSGCCPDDPSPGDLPSGDRSPGAVGQEPPRRVGPWIVGSVRTPVGEVPRVDTAMHAAEYLGTWKARWGIGRMQYRVEPGLYAVGTPTPESPVFVSANYKMSFDRLRSQLAGIDGWILVLDTKGINVWCAAGKGTFGTEEMVRQVRATGLAEIVSHRVLIVPQLGAPGVAAHHVKEQSGFRVVYGPVRAEDLPAFLAANMKATPEMRRVRFPLPDRLAVAPVELVMSARYALLITACFFFLAGLGPDGYAWGRATTAGTWSAILFVVACVGTTLLTPALLPWLPGRALALKGAWLGLAFLLGFLAWGDYPPHVMDSWPIVTAWCLLIPTVASFMAMNYTGSTTYTSLSGVRLEVRVAGRIQAACAMGGVAFWLVGRFV